MKFIPVSKFTKFLPALPLLLAAPAADAFVVSFTVANRNSAQVSTTGSAFTGAATGATVAPGTTPTGTVQYAVTGDLDGDGIDETLTVTLNLSATGGNPISGPGQSPNGFGVSTAAGANGDLQSGESITFTYASAVLATGATSTGLIVDTVTPFDFVNANGNGNGAFTFTKSSTVGTFATTPDTFVTVTGTGGRGGVNNTLFDVNIVPEPSSAMLLGAVGVLGLLRRRR